MNKAKKAGLFRTCVFLLCAFVSVICPLHTVWAYSDDMLDKYDSYQIYFFNEEQGEWGDDDCVERGGIDDPGAGTTLSGSGRLEKIWNYIVDLGISGLSDNPSAIAGILGNMSVETGGTFNPFIQNPGGCTGLIQWCPGKWNDGFFSYMSKYSKYYFKGKEPNIDESIIDRGIGAELDFLFKNGSNGVTAQPYVSTLNVPTNKTGAKGARAYADLFLVKVERAFDDEKKYSGTGPIEDPGVAAVADHTYYQAAGSRRDRAEKIFNQNSDNMGGGGGSTGGGDGDDGNVNYCDDYDEPEAGNLASYVKAWAWPEYHEPPFLERMPAYAEYMDSGKTPYHPCNGVDCGAFVSNIIKASGWDPNYQLGDTNSQADYLAKNWNKVDASSLKLGDVGIKPGEHVILYVGNIPGFGSNTASASDCRGSHKRAPTAGADKNLSKYTWYRKR